MKAWIPLTLCLCSTACTHIDTGQADYRVADPPGSAERLDGNTAACGSNSDCERILPGRVTRRYEPGPAGAAAFENDDVFSIELEQGVIGSNILEGNILGQQFGHNAEIAILANVFEFAADADQAAHRRFLESTEFTSDEATQMKLVYFSDDVHRHQPFSFSNIPLFQRSKYTGRSIGIQIVIMEVDAQSGPIASLMETLAGFGQGLIPGPPELTSIIFNLGKSLVSGGGGDDRLLDYRFVLSAADLDSSTMEATFAPGRYVLRRSQNRTAPMEWANLRLDHNTARLYRRQAGGTGWAEVQDDLYLVLNIRKYDRSTAPEVYQHQQASTFLRALHDAAESDSAPIPTIIRDLQGMLLNARSSRRRSDLAQLWGAADRKLRRYSLLALGGLNEDRFAGCLDQARRIRTMRDNAKQEATVAVRSFREAYAAALRPPAQQGGQASGTSAPTQQPAQTGTTAPTAAELEFTTADREALVLLVSRYFTPWTTEVTADRFASHGAFEGAFLSDDALATLAISRAEATDRVRPGASCELLAGL